MPGQEEGIQVHVLGAVDVNHRVVHVPVDGGGVLLVVEL